MNLELAKNTSIPFGTRLHQARAEGDKETERFLLVCTLSVNVARMSARQPENTNIQTLVMVTEMLIQTFSAELTTGKECALFANMNQIVAEIVDLSAKHRASEIPPEVTTLLKDISRNDPRNAH